MCVSAACVGVGPFWVWVPFGSGPALPFLHSRVGPGQPSPQDGRANSYPREGRAKPNPREGRAKQTGRANPKPEKEDPCPLGRCWPGPETKGKYGEGQAQPTRKKRPNPALPVKMEGDGQDRPKRKGRVRPEPTPKGRMGGFQVVTLTRDLQHQSFCTTDIQRATEAV